jgi:hypothetical protein
MLPSTLARQAGGCGSAGTANRDARPRQSRASRVGGRPRPRRGHPSNAVTFELGHPADHTDDPIDVCSARERPASPYPNCRSRQSPPRRRQSLLVCRQQPRPVRNRTTLPFSEISRFSAADSGRTFPAASHDAPVPASPAQPVHRDLRCRMSSGSTDEVCTPSVRDLRRRVNRTTMGIVSRYSLEP